LSLKTSETLNLSAVDIKDIVETAVDLSKVYLGDKGIEFQVENVLVAKVIANPESLVAVIINLVKNAVEAFNFVNLDEDAPENGKYIKIKTDKIENQVQIMVSNNAPGIREPERIFYEGYTTKSAGSGLGLWICKKSVEEMGGELSLSRSIEDYTEFTIQLGGEE
jgi:signal transduction histidine kinase